MFIPIGDQPNPKGTPFITYGLIAANVLIFVLVSLPQQYSSADPEAPSTIEYARVLESIQPGQVSVNEITASLSSYDVFIFEHGYRPSDPSLMDMLTSMFLHAGLGHLLGNMLFLWIYGDNVEHRLRPVAFLAWYLVAGVAAVLFHQAFALDSPIPLVGASGAISGVLGFYFVWFPHNQIRVLMFWFIIIRVFMLPARWVLGFYIVATNILPFLITQDGGAGVAYGAHIGGFLAGAAVALVLDRREMFSRPKEYKGAHESPASGMGATIAKAIADGRFEKAAELYFDVPAARSHGILEPSDSLALGSWLATHGHTRAALSIFQRHLRDHPRGPGLAEAHAQAGLLQLHAFQAPTAAYQHLIEALEYDPSRTLEKIIREALDEIAAVQKFPVQRVH